MNKLLPSAVICASLFLFGCESSPLKTKSLDEKSTIGIPYEKFKLDNGLTVILHKDNSDPLVNVNVTYHVGSAREKYGNSGFAHFFEHMMFQGSEHVADEEHFRIITEAGGNLNGSTSSDITNYYQTVPINQLEKVLWLEADRMGFLLPAVTQEKFENQRETVKNERGQRIDNQPYGLRSERVSEALYPIGHPYSWPTIGYVEDLDRVNVNDLKAFFQRWYGPNNAVLTIGGDIDIKQTTQWINKYFGPIKKGPKVEMAEKQAPVLDQTRYITIEDQVHLPLLQITLPTVYVRHPDEAPLDVLADILGGGKTSLFYKNLVKEGFAVQSFVSHPCRELACEFQLLALANPQKVLKLADLKKIIDDTLLEFEDRGVIEDDLLRVKAGIEASTVFSLESVGGKVNRLASGETFDQQPDLIQTDIARYNAVTAEDVMRVYTTYVKDKAAVILSIVPRGQMALEVQASNFTLPTREIRQLGAIPAVVAPTIADTFDRSITPPAGTNPIVDIPDFWRSDFANGLSILGVNSTEMPTISFNLSLEGAALLDPIDKLGLAGVTAQLMNESTLLSSSEELANRLALLGSSISFQAGGRYTTIYVSSLAKNIDATLAILKEKLFQPAFKEDELALLKQRMLQSLKQSINNPSVLARRARDKALYSENSRIGLPDEGTLKTIQSITINDVKKYYQTYYSPTYADAVLVGDIEQVNALPLFDFLQTWQASPYTIPSFDNLPEYKKGKLFIVDKPDAVQTVVTFTKPAMPYDATGEFFKASLMNFPLGGMFNSRINLNLREDKGYTYGASSNFSAGKTLGTYNISANVTASETLASINELIGEISRFQSEGMTETELSMLKSAYTQRDALNFETPSKKAGFLKGLLSFDLDKEYRQQQARIIDEISKEELNKIAKQWLNVESMHIIVVGDAKKLREELKVLSRDIVEMTVPQ